MSKSYSSASIPLPRTPEQLLNHYLNQDAVHIDLVHIFLQTFSISLTKARVSIKYAG